MAFNYVFVLKDKVLRSETTVQSSSRFAIREHDNTCMIINLRTKYVVKQLQKSLKNCKDEEDASRIRKLCEIISKLGEQANLESLGWIYFKTENNEVFPMLFICGEFLNSIRKNLFDPVLLLEGQLYLKDRCGCTFALLSLKSKRFHTSFKFSELMEPVRLASGLPFSVERVQPIEDHRWVIFYFFLSIGWKEEPKTNGLATQLNSSTLLKNLFERDDRAPKDFKLVAGSGTEIPCHGLILAARSPVLSAMVHPEGAMKESVSKRIEMEAFSEETLKTFVSYLYCQEVLFQGMEWDTALELFRLGHMYGLPELTGDLSKMLMEKKDPKWFSPNGILELYFLVRNMPEFRKLAEHAADIMTKMSQEDIRGCERYKELDAKGTIELLWMLSKLHTA